MRNRIAAISLFGAISLASGCLGKLPGAVEAQGEDWSAIIADCQTAQLYVEKAEPSLQTKCKDCHAAGGSGSGKFSLNGGSDLTTNQIGANFKAFVENLAEDDGGDPDANPILGYALGNLGGHQKALTVTDTEYALLRDFVLDYREFGACAGVITE